MESCRKYVSILNSELLYDSGNIIFTHPARYTVHCTAENPQLYIYISSEEYVSYRYRVEVYVVYVERKIYFGHMIHDTVGSLV